MKPTSTPPGAGIFPAVPPVYDVSALIEANRRILLAAAEAQLHLLERLRRSNEEMVRFLDHRLQDDRETAKKLAACGSLPEMWSIAMTFAQRGSREYAEEAGVLTAAAAEQAGEALDDLRREAEAAASKEDRAKAA